MKTLFLNSGEDKRLRAGHLWIFSNEVDTKRSPLRDFEPGEPARVAASSGRPLGAAYVNPASLISARMVSTDPGDTLGPDLLRHRLQAALALRERLFDIPCYRLAFGEGDLLPGLVVDRFGDVLVVQITTAGMERVADDIVSVLTDLLQPRAVLLKNDSQSRALEGLPIEVRGALGDIPESVSLSENGLNFVAPLAAGQKTGWFYDMRANRKAFASLCDGARVLDVFSYVGALGVTALAHGAREATCVDSSELALGYARRNAELAGRADSLHTLCGDAFEIMRRLRDEGKRFDAVSVDPPAFIKRKKDFRQGLEAYATVNRLAMDLLADGGLLLSCSCSQHLSREDLRATIQRSAAKAGRFAQIIHQGHQGPDHPIHPAMPETDYLKGYVCRVLKG